MSNAADSGRKALGRGLSALLPGNRPQPAAEESAPRPPAGALHLPIDDIDPNPLQPRTVFQADRLNELAQSIRENGIIQPLIVRTAGNRYQLIAGERRWRAAKLAGLDHVPALIQDYADDRLIEITLIENIQREDLNPIEVAHAFDRLVKEHSLSHEQIAQRTGKDRSTITNMLRLLRLPGGVQLLLAEHRLSMGQARALLALPAAEMQIEAADKIVAQGLSVRQVERLVNKMTEPSSPQEPALLEQDPNLKVAVLEMERALGTRVRVIEKPNGSGRVEIEYYSQDELNRLYERIVGEN